MNKIIKKILLIFTIAIIAIGMLMVMSPGTIFSQENTVCEGTVTVEKYLDGSPPTTGSFDFVVKYPDDTEITYTLISPNYQMTILLPCGDYEIREEHPLPSGIGFVRITSIGLSGAVIDGNSITFALSSGDNGTIGIMNDTYDPIANPFKCSQAPEPGSCTNEFRIPEDVVGVDAFGNGDFNDGTLYVTISNYNSGPYEGSYGFDWSSNIPICYLIVKLGNPFARGYSISGATSGSWPGGGLNEAGQTSAISHVSFCYGSVDLGEIQLTKSGLDCDDTAYFKLKKGTDYYNTDGSVVLNPGTYDGEEVTCSPDNVVTWSNLPWGTYTFEETIPAGYTFGGYTPDPPGNTIEIDADNASTTVEVNASNTKILGIIQLTKSGLDCDDTAYFKLKKGTDYYDTTGKVVLDPINYDGEPVTCSPKNVVIWSNLPWGTYTIEEDIPAGYAFGGYTPDPPGNTIEINANNAGQTVEVNATNPKVEASIQICKEVDENITATEFHFKITGSNIADKLVTVNAGKCSGLIGLPLGTYEVWETDIGYTVTIKVGGVVEVDKKTSPQSVTVVLDKDDIGKTITVDFLNDPGVGKIELTKNGLSPGAQAFFKLTDGTDYYDTNGDKITGPYDGEKVVSASNVVTWSNLPWGTYTFEETIPAGYTFGGYSETMPITIDETNQAAIVAV
ncbi:hypothetical protein ES703_100112 [subsurface metagenome]